MSLFIFHRATQTCLVLLVMSILVFVGVYAVGDPVDILAPPEATLDEIAEVKASLGLDKPLWFQYLKFLRNALKGDLGTSFVYNEPAIKLIIQRMPATLELALAAMLLTVLLGIPLGLWAGLRSETASGKAIMIGSHFGFSLPSFWVGMMLILLFSIKLGWLPATGRGQLGSLFGIRTSIFTSDGWAHLFLPAMNLSLFNIALIIRLIRAGVGEHLQMDYVRFARAKGVRETRIILVHVLKNIMIPVVTVLGLQLGWVIAFSVVTETIFAWPGMGKLIIDSISQLDRPVIVAYLLITAVIVTIINLAVDIVYTLLDPRIRLTEVE